MIQSPILSQSYYIHISLQTNRSLIYSRLLSIGLPAERFLLGAGLVLVSTLAPVDAREAEDGELGRGRKRDCRPAIGSSFKPYQRHASFHKPKRYSRGA